MIEIHAYHGWGFNGKFWDSLKAEFPTSILFKAANRGYFEEPYEPVFSSESSIKIIIFTHSYGLHWCPKEKIGSCDYLVIFNGFNEFLSKIVFERKRIESTQQMHVQFQTNPYAVLNAFYNNCFYPYSPTTSSPKIIDKSLLESDLIDLSKQILHIQKRLISKK